MSGSGVVWITEGARSAQISTPGLEIRPRSRCAFRRAIHSACAAEAGPILDFWDHTKAVWRPQPDSVLPARGGLCPRAATKCVYIVRRPPPGSGYCLLKGSKESLSMKGPPWGWNRLYF